MRRLPGWKPPTVKPEIGPDGEPIVPEPTADSKQPREPVIAAFKDVSDKHRSDGQDAFRQNQMLEVYNLKERLARDNCPTQMRTIKKALLIPEEASRIPSKFTYPDPKNSLMPNPWPKKKKKSKKKGKKK